MPPSAAVPRQRLLLLTSRFPFPARSGDSIRLLHLARALSADYDLTLLSLCERTPDAAAMADIEPFQAVHTVVLPRWKSYLRTALALPTNTPLQLAYYRSNAFRRALRALLPSHDGVLAHLHRTGQYVESLPENTPAVLEMTDAISLQYRRVRDSHVCPRLRRLLYSLEQGRLLKYERRIPARFDRTWLVSPVDIEYLYGQEAPSGGACIPVPVDLREYPFQGSVRGSTVLFIGNLRSVQNRDACAWFTSAMLPALRERVPGLRFRISGPVGAQFRAAMEAVEGVELTGEVASIAEHLDDVFCGVCPVRLVAGLQNKVLNYLALGLPCVTSELGLEGIDARPGADLLCFQTEREAVEQIAALQGSADLRDSLAARGLEVARRYSTEAVYPRVRAQAAAAFGAFPEKQRTAIYASAPTPARPFLVQTPAHVSRAAPAAPR